MSKSKIKINVVFILLLCVLLSIVGCSEGLLDTGLPDDFDDPTVPDNPVGPTGQAYYVSVNAEGVNDGSDWTNAWQGPEDIDWDIIEAGDVIYIAGGTYNKTLDVQGNGTEDEWIFIKRATDSEHGINLGWVSEYDNTVRFIDGANIKVNTQSFINIDGVVKDGFYVDSAEDYNWEPYGIDVRGSNNVKIQYVTVDGSNNEKDIRGVYNVGSSNIEYSHLNLKNLPNDGFVIYGNNITIEHCVIGPKISSIVGKHGDGLEIQSTTNTIFRYNTLDWAGDGFMFGSTGEDVGTLHIYGNIFTGGGSAGGNSFKTNSKNPDVGPLYIYNNTFYDLYRSLVLRSNTTAYIKNNIFYDVDKLFADFGIGVHDYNYFMESTSSDTRPPDELHRVIGDDPFVDVENGDYRLVPGSTAIDAGVDLGELYQKDRAGNIRGADGSWDIGVYEFLSGSTDDQHAPGTPAALTAEVLSSTEISLSWNESIDNIGVTSYNLYRRTLEQEEYELIASVTDATYTDDDVDENINYQYTVTAVDEAGNESDKHFDINIWCREGSRTIWAESCSQEDVQAAINTANNGDTVILPAGTGNWETRVKVEYKGLIIQGTGVDKTKIRSAGTGTLIYFNRFNDYFARITGISFHGNDQAIAIDMHALWGSDGRGPALIRIDHNRFEHCSSRAVLLWRYIEGLIDNNEFINNAASDVVYYGDNDWAYHRPETLGSIHAVYIENNTFTYTGEGNDPNHAVASNDGARYVFRNNYISCNTRRSGYHLGAPIDAHGNHFSGRGTFSYEVYGNTINSDSWRGMYIRGGTGVIYDNDLQGNYNYPIHLTNYNSFRGDYEEIEYPCIDQIHDLYIWDNRYNGEPVSAEVMQDGNVPLHIQEGRDFFHEEKADYVPFEYPHPWTEVYPQY
ncbi:MAG: hypothetical protein ACLFPF_06995 [Halanaerobiales bacterium]